MQFNVKRAIAFCVGHLVRRGNLVSRRVSSQTVSKKLLVAGHKLRVRNVEVIIRTDAIILLRIEVAAKLALDHNRLQVRHAEFSIEISKLRRTHGLVHHLPDDLLLAHSKQCSVFLGSRRLANSLEENRQ